MSTMGLVDAARQIQSYGRGPDKQLAHIAPDEAEFLDYVQGGRKENPHTGLPEYSAFGQILKIVARVAGGIGGFMVGGPAGAAAGSAAATKLTGGSWKDALKSGALSGIGGELGQGLSGGSWNVLGNGTPLAGAVSGAGSAAGSGAGAAGQSFMAGTGEGLGGLSSNLSSLPGSTSGFAVGAGQGLGGLTPNLSAFAGSAPAASGAGGFLSHIGGWGGAAAGFGSVLNPDSVSALVADAPKLGNNINLNVSPFERVYQPYTGDPAKFGLPADQGGAGGWQFFDEVNPKPKYLSHGGPVHGYAFGGMVGPQGPGNGLGGLSQIRMPGVPSQIEAPHFDDQAALRQQAQNMSPAAQRDNIRRAAMLGYVNAADGGSIHGPGDGQSDSIDAKLSDGEHVLDADLVSSIGGGSNDAGHKKIEQMKYEIRRAVGRKNPHKAMPKKNFTGAGLAAKVMR